MRPVLHLHHDPLAERLLDVNQLWQVVELVGQLGVHLVLLAQRRLVQRAELRPPEVLDVARDDGLAQLLLRHRDLLVLDVGAPPELAPHVRVLLDSA